ncbi:Fatty acid-binding protein [Fulvia fulva]|uniref:Fatty acid-binding protein n=1 Tax=Passalora fulva TaxID=5499 RepID=A0A9Q8UUG2_PASFU|nr:Fatty acid-binding protein [Fulvia fulva]KAK4626552.1 Fatty acid-binding protein [Fulvia fulva]KAK4628160.1 Fatty acid-binding protein [Fulvia fulva]UJO22901.1 Fatty acid-binding protein [Fulvia fulva]WPV13878.1 Fatty acid-binding protein [Fulvia fulva]WPV28234.1 Fatty acid-binding protein [Fulvia fulva]
MGLKEEAWPSSASFDDLAEALSDPQSKKDAIKQAGTIFAFTLKNDKGEEKSWFIDLKETGVVGKGLAPEGKKADVTMILSDENFAKLIVQKANAQKLFMSGKLKVKGNVMKATKLEPILKRAQPKAKL